MKTPILYIEARKKFNLKDIDISQLDLLISKPNIKKISLAATIQYLDLIPIIKKHIQNKHKSKKITIKQGAYYKAHVLGCQSQAFDKKADILILLA